MNAGERGRRFSCRDVPATCEEASQRQGGVGGDGVAFPGRPWPAAYLWSTEVLEIRPAVLHRGAMKATK